MEYNDESVAVRQSLVLFALSILVAAAGVAFYRSWDAVPFVVGVALGCALNITKVILLRQAVLSALKRDANAAVLHIRITYFLRLLLTVAVLLAAALLPDNIINVLGTAFTLLTWPIAMYSMRFFLRHELVDDIMTASTSAANDPTKDAIDKINEITAGKEQNSPTPETNNHEEVAKI